MRIGDEIYATTVEATESFFSELLYHTDKIQERGEVYVIHQQSKLKS